MRKSKIGKYAIMPRGLAFVVHEWARQMPKWVRPVAAGGARKWLSAFRKLPVEDQEYWVRTVRNRYSEIAGDFSEC